MLGVNPGFGFGNSAISIGVAAFDSRIVSGIRALDHMLFMFENQWDIHFCFAFSALAFGRIAMAHSFVKDARGGIILELDSRPRLIAVDGLLMGNASSPEALAESN